MCGPGLWSQVVLIRLSLRGYVRTPLYSSSQTFLLSLAIDPCVYLRYSFVQSSTPWHYRLLTITTIVRMAWLDQYPWIRRNGLRTIYDRPIVNLRPCVWCFTTARHEALRMMDTLARYPLTLEVDKTLEVRTTTAQLIELVRGRQMKGLVNRFRITLADPLLIKTIVSRDRTIFFDLLSRLHLRSNWECTSIHLLLFGTGCFWRLVIGFGDSVSYTGFVRSSSS